MTEPLQLECRCGCKHFPGAIEKAVGKHWRKREGVCRNCGKRCVVQRRIKEEAEETEANQ